MTSRTPSPRSGTVAGDAVTIGIDLGGTGIRVVALGAAGDVRGAHGVPTPRDPGRKTDTVAALARMVERVAAGARIRAIGIGASGPVGADGVIRNDATLPAFSHIPVNEMLAERFGAPCVVDNDAVAAAIGENAYGAGERSPALLVITVGTGIGVALLTGPGTPYRGADGTHPEGGHIPVTGGPAPCYCGLDACWEQVASRTALDTLTGHATARVAAAARAGDTGARALFAEYGARLGGGTGTLLTVLRPARLVLAGSAAQYLPLFADGFERALTRRGSFRWIPPYAAARLGASSGAIGAAVLARGAGTP